LMENSPRSPLTGKFLVCPSGGRVKAAGFNTCPPVASEPQAGTADRRRCQAESRIGQTPARPGLWLR
jgi:hypothetical protein